MDLTRSINYPTGRGKWSLVGPVRCALDDQFIALCEQFEEMNAAERDAFTSTKMYADTGWALLTFARCGRRSDLSVMDEKAVSECG